MLCVTAQLDGLMPTLRVSPSVSESIWNAWLLPARLVQEKLNPSHRLTGILLTMFDPRTRLADQVVAEVRGHFGPLVYDSVIPRQVRLAEAPSFGQPITRYDPASRGAVAYRNLAEEVAGNGARAGAVDPREARA